MSKTPILGKSVATAEQMAKYLLSKNPEPKIDIPVEDFCRLFLYMGAIEGVRGDLEFARSCLETGNFAFRGTVLPEQNNYCGHGTTSSTNRGSYFPDEATGILAQVQHAKAYATAEALNYECLDSRYKYVKLGSAPNMEDMGGKWAVPGYDTKKYSSLEEANAAEDSYGYKIVNILNGILGKTEEENEPEVSKNPLEGRTICLDAGHYGKYNRCPSIPEYYESDMAWKLHMLLKKYLEELGARVVLTRMSQNEDRSLHTRGVSSLGSDLFLSIHSNAVGSGMNEGIDYVAVYHLVEDSTTQADEISAEVAKALAPVIASTMGTSQGYKILTRKSSNDRNKDGMMNDNYYGVLNGARAVNVPGLILEHSFHTNSKSVRWLLKDSNLDQLARAEADAIAAYFSDKGKCEADVPFLIKVANVPENDVLYIRKDPDYRSEALGFLQWNDHNLYTIVEVENGWGKLKSGLGWINLKYTERY